MKSRKIIGLLLAVVIAAASLLTSVVCAEPFTAHTGPYIINLDGQVLESDKALAHANKDGQLMLPLRLIAEGLKYQVSWNKAQNSVELTKEGGKKIVAKIGEDCNFNGGSEPIKTGAVTECSKGITYVSRNFVSVLLNVQVKMYEGGQIVLTSRVLRDYGILGIVKSVDKTENGGKVLIEGTAVGKATEKLITLNISDSTKIVNPVNNAELTIDSIKVGDMVRGFYGPAVARSNLPQAQALLLEVFGDARLSVGTIAEIDKDVKRILISDNTGNKLWVNLAEGVRIVDVDGYTYGRDTLKVGKEVEVYHSAAMTKSLPPETQGLRILLVGEIMMF